MSPEFLLITHQIAPQAGQSKQVILGIGDDAALLPYNDQDEQVVAMDTLVAGRHFLHEQPAFDVGWKSLAVNLSDLASMGSVPQFALLSLSLPPDLEREAWVTGFMQGWQALADTTGIVLVGGDTTSSPVLSITVTVIGKRPAASRRMLRQSACMGDDLWVSGSIGSAGLALTLQTARQHIPDSLAQALHRPIPRLALGQALLPWVNAAMDISDGLLADLSHLLRASGDLGATLDWHSIPMPADVRDWAEKAPYLPLTSGDDYELLFTAPVSMRDQIQTCAVASNTPVTRIGYLNDTSSLQVIKHGQMITLPSQLGFDHFQPAQNA